MKKIESKIYGGIKRKLTRPTTIPERKDRGKEARIESKKEPQKELYNQQN